MEPSRDTNAMRLRACGGIERRAGGSCRRDRVVKVATQIPPARKSTELMVVKVAALSIFFFFLFLFLVSFFFCAAHLMFSTKKWLPPTSLKFCAREPQHIVYRDAVMRIVITSRSSRRHSKSKAEFLNCCMCNVL